MEIDTKTLTGVVVAVIFGSGGGYITGEIKAQRELATITERISGLENAVAIHVENGRLEHERIEERINRLQERVRDSHP